MSVTVTGSITVDAPRAGARGWMALAVLMLPVLLVSVDNTVLNFALPAISGALTPTGTELLWIIDAYPLVLAGFLVSMGSLGDRVGRRKLLMIGSIGFGLVSVLAAFATSAWMLIAARALLGFFGAMLMPPTLSLLRNIFLNRDQRRMAIAVWASGFAAGSALGPLVGGVLLEHFWWGAVFLLAVPVLLPMLILTPLLIPESKDPEAGRIDVPSIALVLLTMVPVVFAIKHFAESGFDQVTIVSLLVGIGAGWIFIRRQLSLESPMLDLALFRRRAFSSAVLINMLSVVALVGGLYFVSQHLQLVLGLPPIEAGLVLLPGLLVMIAAGLLVVPISRRVRPRYVVPGALVFSVLGYGMVAVTGGEISALGLGVAFVALGLGIGAAETVSNELIQASVPAEKAGEASGVSETAYEVGAVLGTATLGTVLTASYRANVVLPSGLTETQAAAASETLGGAVNVAGELSPSASQALLTSAQHAFDSGVGVTAWIGVSLVIVAAVIAFVGLRGAR